MGSVTDSISNFFKGEATDKSLRDLFLHELKDIYYAEKKLVDNLPTMADKSTTPELRSAFVGHLEETQNQVSRLEEVFRLVGEQAEEVTCEAMDGLVDEGEEVIGDTADGTLTRDAGLIVSAQKIEHYEISAYGSLRTIAQMLGYSEAAQLLEKTLDEEKAADAKLTKIAESFVNQRAAAEQ